MSTRLSSHLPTVLTALPNPRLPKHAIFELLQNHRRRYAFHYLRQRNEPVSLRQLSDQVAAWEHEKPLDALSHDECQRVYVSLLQTHIPKMVEQHVVQFDEPTKTIQLSTNAAGIEIYLETVEGNDIPWAQYYFGLTAFSSLFLILVLLRIPPFVTFAEGVGLAIVVIFGMSALLHHRYLQQHRLGTEGAPPE